MNSRPLFSILHPSARPDQWRKIYDAWLAAAVHPEDYEYILCADERWGFKRAEFPIDSGPMLRSHLQAGVRTVWNESRRCYVDSVNTAAKTATGQILIVIADDQYPCDKWDEALLTAINRVHPECERFGFPRIAVSVSTGTPQEHERGIMVMPILSRERYNQLGYVFYPEYESMYADNDFCEHARQDGVVIDARHLMFPHRHPLAMNRSEVALEDAGSGNQVASRFCESIVVWDAAYSAQNRPEAYALGKKLLDRRRAVKFNGIAPEAVAPAPPAQDSRSILICLPGESFSRHWAFAWTQTLMHLVARGFTVTPWFNYCSSAAITRGAFAMGVMSMEQVPDFILWMDDDQVVLPHHVDRLIAAMDAKQDADLIAGWTWIQDDSGALTKVSCGVYSADGANVLHAPVEEMLRLQKAGAVAPVEWTGFPVVLMRGSTIEKASEAARKRNAILLRALDALEGRTEGSSTMHPSTNPFCPIMAPTSQWGHGGEDVSFCQNVKAAGGNIYVDATVFVEHLKLRCVAPPSVNVTPVEPEKKGRVRVALEELLQKVGV